MLRGQPASSAYSRIAVLPSRPSGGRIWDSTEHESKRLPRRALLQAKPTEGNRTRDAGRPQTWHYGLIAKWWSEFNVDFRPHEIPYFQRHIERNGQPALDVACGTGRLLLPYLRAGLDVDGCDVSADMIELCREKATREGLSPTLFVQPMHELDPPRRYKAIFICGAFGLGSTREQDFEALRRFHEYFEQMERCFSTSKFQTPIRNSGGSG
jgi:SAM-dependent methyltransferase